MAGIAGSGVGSEPAGFADCCASARLIDGISAVSKSRMAKQNCAIRQVLSARAPKPVARIAEFSNFGARFVDVEANIHL